MINLAIVGLGPVWENRYRPVLEKLRHRIRVRAVFDPIASRCEQVAFQFGAIPYQGVVALLNEADVRGILVLDTSWHGNALLHFVRKARKPAYIAGSLGENWDELSELRSLVESEGLLIMPEFSRRFTPATCRLRELIATRLGRPRQISITATPPAPDAPDAVPGQAAGTDFLVGILDWCRYVVRSATVRLEARSDPPGTARESPQFISIQFAELRDPGHRPTVEIALGRPQPSGQNEPLPALVSFRVVCEGGEAIIERPDQIQWTVAGGEGATESLTADRSEVEVMIDHFCRRLVGGLIPIADISDVCQSLGLIHAARESQAKQAPVQLNGNGR